MCKRQSEIISSHQQILSARTLEHLPKPCPFKKNYFMSKYKMINLVVQLFSTPWTAAHQASLSITNSWSLLRFLSVELVMPSNHVIFCYPLLLLPSIVGSFLMSQFFASSGQSIRASVSASVFPMNIQD